MVGVPASWGCRPLLAVTLPRFHVDEVADLPITKSMSHREPNPSGRCVLSRTKPCNSGREPKPSGCYLLSRTTSSWEGAICLSAGASAQGSGPVRPALHRSTYLNAKGRHQTGFLYLAADDQGHAFRLLAPRRWSVPGDPHADHHRRPGCRRPWYVGHENGEGRKGNDPNSMDAEAKRQASDADVFRNGLR